MTKFRIYQIELSSFCNMRCAYCPHPTMERKKGFMTEEVLLAAISWAKRSGAERLVLHHFGEPLMHPQISRFIRLIGDAGMAVQFSTNGLLLATFWPELVASGVDITVMLAFHQWAHKGVKDYGEAVSAYQARAAGTAITVVPSYALKEGKLAIHSWGKGLLDGWDAAQCPFLRYNLGVILWNGDIATCCVDHDGRTAKQNILTSGFEQHVSQRWDACASCDVGRLMKNEVY